MICINLMDFESYVCTDCNLLDPVYQFGIDNKGRRITICLSCKVARAVVWQKQNPGKVKEHKHREYIKHKDAYYDNYKQWVKAHPGERYSYRKEWLSSNREKTRGYERAYTYMLRDIVFEHYGIICKHCGVVDIDVLSVDHVNNDGNEHRKIARNNYSIYKDIIEAGFPDSFQILCRNCNWKKWINGGVL